MSRTFRITLLLLLFAVLAGILEFPALRMEVLRPGLQEQSEEAARREVIRPVADGRQDHREKVPIFWLSAVSPRELAAVETPLALGAEPAQRARVALETLITGAPTPERRPLPLGTTLQAFYLLSDGTAIADFSDALSHELPSGISTEQLAVDAIVHTLHAAVPQVRRLRILIDGQEAETLAGHVDLTSAFDLSAMALAAATPAPAAQGPVPATPAPAVQPVSPPRGKGPAQDEKKPPAKPAGSRQN